MPGQLYRWPGGRLPHTLKAYTKNGVLEELPGPPAIGFDVETIGEDAIGFVAPPAKEEIYLDASEVCRRLGWTGAELEHAIARLGFPKHHRERTKLVQTAIGNVEPMVTFLWLESAIDAWQQSMSADGSGLLARIMGR